MEEGKWWEASGIENSITGDVAETEDGSKVCEALKYLYAAFNWLQTTSNPHTKYVSTN